MELKCITFIAVILVLVAIIVYLGTEIKNNKRKIDIDFSEFLYDLYATLLKKEGTTFNGFLLELELQGLISNLDRELIIEILEQSNKIDNIFKTKES